MLTAFHDFYFEDYALRTNSWDRTRELLNTELILIAATTTAITVT
jgi:hypothetical protein